MTGNHADSTRRIRKWQFISLCLAALLGGSAFTIAGYLFSQKRNVSDSLARLSSEVLRLRQEQTMPATLLSHYRGSICYIYSSWTVDRPEHLRGPGRVQLRTSGTGFVVANGMIATNRHVLQPDYEDPETNAYLSAGAQPRLEKMVAFFPGLAQPVFLHGINFSRTADLAVARFDLPHDAAPIAAIPLSSGISESGDAIVVVGYPLGAAGMVAKSPQRVYERLALDPDTIKVVSNLAELSLIRPSSTYGHLGDIVGDKLIYDAPTAHGGSGGPVFNTRGEVIAINSAYMNGFAGGTIGFSVNELKPLIAQEQIQ